MIVLIPTFVIQRSRVLLHLGRCTLTVYTGSRAVAQEMYDQFQLELEFMWRTIEPIGYCYYSQYF